jgi:hypothetical protein
VWGARVMEGSASTLFDGGANQQSAVMNLMCLFCPCLYGSCSVVLSLSLMFFLM